MEYTTAYDQFILIDGNRSIDPLWVDALCRVFQETGIIRPILITEDFEVLDGQHTLMACKLLHIPVPYSVVSVAEGISLIDAVEKLNRVRKAWSTSDYLKLYMSQGNMHYIRFNEVYQHLGYPLRFTIFMGSSSYITGRKKSIAMKFKTGQFECTQDMKDHIQDLGDQMNEIRFFDGINGIYPNQDAFHTALFKLCINPYYAHHQMMDNLKQGDLHHCPNVADYLHLLKKIYNKAGAFRL